MADLRLAQVCHLLLEGFNRKGLAAIQITGVPLASSSARASTPARAGFPASVPGSPRARWRRHAPSQSPSPCRAPSRRCPMASILGDKNRIGRVGRRFPFDSGEVPARARPRRRSLARWASSWLRRLASRSAWVLTAFFQAKAALLPLAIAEVAISIRSGPRGARNAPRKWRLRLLLVAMQLSAQAFELSAGCLIQGIVEQAPLLVRPAALFLHLNIHMADLVNFPYRQPEDATPASRFGSTSFWRRGGDGRCIHGRQRGCRDAALISKSFGDHGVSLSKASCASGPWPPTRPCRPALSPEPVAT